MIKNNTNSINLTKTIIANNEGIIANNKERKIVMKK